jgi:pyruvate ferredoxin oxidoreductase alpha subunit
VAKYLPTYKPMYSLHPDKIVSMGAFGMPEIYTEQKKALDHVMANSKEVVLKAWDELAQLTGRRYAPVETYKAEGADTLILGMGSICETASLAVDQLREQGKNVGLVKLRLWRPFPLDEVRATLGAAKDVVVLDRAISPGAGTLPLSAEIKSVMYGASQRPNIHSVVAGLGGRDVTPADVVKMVGVALSGQISEYYIYGVRG